MTSPPVLPIDAGIDQVGIVVRDVQAMAETFHRLLGIGPFRILDWPIPGIDPQSTYHGEPRSYRIRLGFAQAGATQIELVEPLDDRSIWSDFLADHGPGLHHFRITVANFDEIVAALQAAGLKNIAGGTGVHVGSRWAYFDTADLLEGIVIEVRTRLEGAGGEGRWATGGIKTGDTQTIGEGPVGNKLMSAGEAVALISDGWTPASGGFVGNGHPEELTAALMTRLKLQEAHWPIWSRCRR